MVILPDRTYFILYITVKLYRIQIGREYRNKLIRIENYFGLINEEFSDVR